MKIGDFFGRISQLYSNYIAPRTVTILDGISADFGGLSYRFRYAFAAYSAFVSA